MVLPFLPVPGSPTASTLKGIFQMGSDFHVRVQPDKRHFGVGIGSFLASKDVPAKP